MKITDELLDYLGDMFQKHPLKTRMTFEQFLEMKLEESK